ncbi:MAG TPA: rod shape-determining protein MreD, partial [Streptosporangiaceae bacterium]|nr:rod shape-determining protein MreD [Streptosporangiaceae bacterium]
MRRLTFALVAILAAAVLQTAVLDRLPLPGGSAPNLVLVLVVTLALASGPTEGMLIGFGAGLALDIAPPASNLLGLSALVFCVIGYGCGRLRGPLERSAWLPLAVVVLGVAAGEALYALAGMTFGDPDITWQSVRLVLPVTVAYDILLCPFVLYAVVRFGGYRGWATAGRREAEPLAGRETAGAGLLGGVAAAGLAAGGAAVRDTRSGREPRLRPGAGRQSDCWSGGHLTGPGQQAGPWVSRRRPLQLRARSGVARSAAQAGQAARPRPAAIPGARGAGGRPSAAGRCSGTGERHRRRGRAAAARGRPGTGCRARRRPARRPGAGCAAAARRSGPASHGPRRSGRRARRGRRVTAAGAGRTGRRSPAGCVTPRHRPSRPGRRSRGRRGPTAGRTLRSRAGWPGPRRAWRAASRPALRRRAAGIMAVLPSASFRYATAPAT